MIKRFVAPQVVAESRHLCKVPAYLREDGRRDEGWSCRLQAFLIGLAVAADRVPCIIAFGRSGFIVGPSGDRPPSGIDVDPHAWVMVDGNGIVDVSPTFEQSELETLREWGHTVIFRGQCSPGDKFVMVRSEPDYDREVAIATHAPMQRTAIYLGRRFDYFDADTIERAHEVAGSPLTEQLIAKHSVSVLFAAARHLYELAHARTTPLAGRTPERAWNVLARNKRDNRSWFQQRLPEKRTPPAESE